ncbi:MAG TPA: OsmC family protein [Longimicrobiaceae bacterium]|nr:OsmC family protein [Longimicrobiaceae bacterium]
MAVEIRGKYLGNLGMELTHGPSGATLRTAAPVDNKGDGSSFSPTDLAAAALGSCIVTTMGIFAQGQGIAFEGASFRVEKHMTGSPRRIEKLVVEVQMPGNLSDAEREQLERIGRACPVDRSLLPEVVREISFNY